MYRRTHVNVFTCIIQNTRLFHAKVSVGDDDDDDNIPIIQCAGIDYNNVTWFHLECVDLDPKNLPKYGTAAVCADYRCRKNCVCKRTKDECMYGGMLQPSMSAWRLVPHWVCRVVGLTPDTMPGEGEDFTFLLFNGNN